MILSGDGNYIYMIVPKEFYNVYKQILIKLADCGINIIKDCTASCKCTNKQVYLCWNIFQSACAIYQSGNAEDIKKAIFMIDYIKAQLNILNDSELPDFNNYKITLKETSSVLGIDGGGIKIEYTTEGNVGTIIAEDNSHGQFSYYYGENFIIVNAVPYTPVEEEETFTITIKGTNGGYTNFNIIRTRPYIKFVPNSAIRDWEGLDSDGKESGIEMIALGDVGTVKFSSNESWIAIPADITNISELYCPITLDVNNTNTDRVGYITATSSKGYTDKLTILQKGKVKTYDVYAGTRNISPSEMIFTSDEITRSNKYVVSKLPYSVSSTEPAKCKWWAIPDGLQVKQILDDSGEDNMQFAKIINLLVNNKNYYVYYLWDNISSTTNYTITIN